MTLFTALSLPIMLLNGFGSIIGGIWLIVLGMWQPIIVSAVLLFCGHWIISIALVPALALMLPAAKTAEKGWTVAAVVFGALLAAYTAAIMLGWSYYIMKLYSEMGPPSAQWPLLLLAYGAATGPWAYWMSKEQDPHSSSPIWVFFLSLAFICGAGARLFGNVSFATCLWIMIGVMAAGLALQLVMVFEQNRGLR